LYGVFCDSKVPGPANIKILCFFCFKFENIIKTCDMNINSIHDTDYYNQNMSRALAEEAERSSRQSVLEATLANRPE
jgi:hypothetical protein